ncbi:high-affinity iron transporter [Candidatus Planktophila limnetica]|jgi:high-affinity iron transporter|uniref:High-affinity iron transporter n=1 Tax=Candidatus Planktophila limnetica TaxID=573600 RepID=A0A249LEP4_9ACTN|nr:iron uptake transporter permease EfeU [Candidatus Planktophila limnetica]ASY27588.1 high-affinity iron transporter [Candidatus Planktophila limnetica]
MLSTFLIALREGLEAALIIGILVAYLVKTGRNHLLTPLWVGVGLAIAASLALGGFLSFTSAELSPRGEEFFAGTTSFLAVGFVTWMIFWMKRAARGLRDELHGKVDSAVGAGSLAIAVTAFVAVVREGLETALFIYTNFKTVGAASSATIGLILGLALAVALGYLIYNRSVKINLSKFFQITGTALVVVAAGVLSYGIHEYQELGWLPGAESFIWDVTSWMAKDSILATVLAGSIGFDTTTSWLQFLVAGAYIAVILWLYLKPARVSKKELISA